MATTNYLRYPDGGGQPSTIKYRPLFQLGERKREFAGENPDIYIDGKWWNSTNGSLYENNGSLTGVTTTNGTIDIYNGMIRVITAGGVAGEGRITVSGLTIGKEVAIKATMFEATVVPRITVYKVDGTTQLDSVTGSGVQEYEYTFVPSETSVIISLFTPSATNGHSTYYDNISVFETEIEADTEYVEQFTYGSKDGKLQGTIIEGGQPVGIEYLYDAPILNEDSLECGSITITDKVSFRGYLLHNLTTAYSIYDYTVEEDSHNAYDGAIYTIPRDGRYTISVGESRIHNSATHTTVDTYLRINNSPLKRLLTRGRTSYSQYTDVAYTETRDMKKGETIYMLSGGATSSTHYVRGGTPQDTRISISGEVK